MDAPRRFGHRDVSWVPSVDHDPRKVVAAWLQHRIALAVRARAGTMSLREMATRVGVNKSTMGRWLAGQEPLNLSALGALAATFGVEVLDAIAVEGDDPICLLPPPYRPLARHEGGHITFARPHEPAWSQLADAMAATVAGVEADGSAHLLTASTLAWALARTAHTLAPTRDLVDLSPADTSVVTFGLEQPIVIAVTLVTDSPAAQIRASILHALGRPRASGGDTSRLVIALTLGRRGGRILEGVLTRTDERSATVSATALARAGVGDPIDADVHLVELAGSATGLGRVVLMEIVKSRDR